MKDKLKIGLLIFFLIILVPTIIGGVFWVKKTVGYKMIYETQVEETVRRMVKPEYLIENR